jgi:hypothetical protein
MAEEEVLPVPQEIPWKLAATTQRLQEGYPDDTTIALFVYEPTTENLPADYPEERLVYFKFTVSVSSCRVDRSTLPEWAGSLLVGGLPVLHLVLDVGVTPEPFATGGFRPYFHAAAPIRRSMIETGVIGQEIYEGESDGLSVGKSASQLYETVGSKVTTNKKGRSGGLPGIFNVGKSSVETTVESERSVAQFQETVNREASTERRELLSHTTNIENVVTLLTAKHVGSPYLRFALSPRPLTPLSVDQGDPNLWYKQLLQRRSSGIEGIQEFIAVVAVPRGRDFCIQAQLRRICVLDDPPVPPVFPGPVILTEQKQALEDYLPNKYPVGTPLDELDVDITPDIEGNVIPAVINWFVIGDDNSLETIVQVRAGYPKSDPNVGIVFDTVTLPYKTAQEVRLEMLRSQYLEDLNRSPLERGVVLEHRTSLRTCFTMPTDGRTEILGSESSVPQVPEVPFDPEISFASPRNLNRRSLDGQSDPTETIARWNTLGEQLAAQVSRVRDQRQQPLSLNNPKIIRLFLRLWRKLPDDDLRNLSLERVASIMRLSSNDVCLLEAAGVKSLRGFAEALLSAAAIQRRKKEMNESIAKLDEKQRCKLGLKSIEYPLTSQDTNRICELIGAALQRGNENDRDYKEGKRQREDEAE